MFCVLSLRLLHDTRRPQHTKQFHSHLPRVLVHVGKVPDGVQDLRRKLALLQLDLRLHEHGSSMGVRHFAAILQVGLPRETCPASPRSSQQHWDLCARIATSFGAAPTPSGPAQAFAKPSCQWTQTLAHSPQPGGRQHHEPPSGRFEDDAGT